MPRASRPRRAKLAAGWPKDLDFATALIRAELIDVRVLLDRAGDVSRDIDKRARIVGRIERYARDAGRGI